MEFKWSLIVRTPRASDRRSWKEGEGNSSHVHPVSLLVLLRLKRHINIEKGESIAQRKGACLLLDCKAGLDHHGGRIGCKR